MTKSRFQDYQPLVIRCSIEAKIKPPYRSVKGGEPNGQKKASFNKALKKKNHIFNLNLTNSADQQFPKFMMLTRE